jgi:probable DNA repair protein
VPLARPIADALRRGATIVAASPRAARVLELRFAEDQRTAGHTIWPSPAIRDWDSWLRDLWRDHAFSTPNAPILLTLLQERTLWTRIQRNDNAPVVSPESMAALAAEAWSLLSAYNAHSARRTTWQETDAEHFRQWADNFERICTRHNWLSASQLESTLVPAIESLTLPPEIVLTGFDRITPAQEAFLAALQSRATINTFAPDSHEPSRTPIPAWIAASDQREEIAAAANWARDLLLENPTARIAIIVPAIASARGEIDRAFRRILMPTTEDIRQPSSLLPWEFSLGLPLADVPAIRAALLLLRWIAEPLHEEEISWLMLSGFVADTVTNHLALANHDGRQRRYGLLSPERSLAAFRESLLKFPALRSLQNHIYEYARAVEAHQIPTTDRQPSAWTELVQLLLDRIAWPGQRPADSLQFQALQRWQRLLDDIALLDFDGALPSYPDFLKILERHALETIFAPESQDAPIQIMGPLASSGQQFDAIWFMNTDDATWPARGRFHPLLPASTQRKFQMPHATPEDDWNLAHKVTARLLNSAPQVVFSYAQRDKDAELRPSPLIASLFPAETKPQPASTPWPASAQPNLEEIPEDSGILPWPHERNAGGSHVLKYQAACPFQAFAAIRLRAQPLDETEWGISPSEKGKLLHNVMQRLFSPTQPAPFHTRDDIVTAIATKQLTTILHAHIDAAIAAQFGSTPHDSWQLACLAAEKRRLKTRIEAWLTLEAERQPFSVEACEQRLENVQVGDLRLNLRADRTDLLADNTRLLLDYKTGLISTTSWQGDRPDDPQLPLYAAFGNVENVSGILFARIRAGKIAFEGSIRDAQAQLSATIGAKKALVTDPYSDAKRDQWAQALEKLAEEFLNGEAAVAPQPHACDNCHFHSLCRIAELNLVTTVEDEETADD